MRGWRDRRVQGTCHSFAARGILGTKRDPVILLETQQVAVRYFIATNEPGVFYTEYLVFPRVYRGNIANEHETPRTGAYFQNFYNLITLITSH